MSKNTNWEKEFKEKFGELNAEQLWLLVKFAKNARLRCRNNAALNNMMGAAFPQATFRQKMKTRKSWKTGLDETYPGLVIQMKLKDGTVSSAGENEDEDE